MSGVPGLTAQPLTHDRDFNWVFLVELLVCGILVVFFLFYFNRLFATLLSYGIRAYTWRRYKVFVDIQALQISLLGGRIFFKGIRYHGKNETILVQGGYVTWQYWLRAVRQVDYTRQATRNSNVGSDDHGSSEKNEDIPPSSGISDAEHGGLSESKDIPCRIAVFAQGVEWIVYNRSPAYDAILNSALKNPDPRASKDTERTGTYRTSVSLEDHPQDLERRGSKLQKRQRQRRSSREHSKRRKLSSKLDEDSSASEDREQAAEKQEDILSHMPTLSSSLPRTRSLRDNQQPQLPLALSLLPISINCQKGAIVLGNENTRVLLTTVFNHVTGTIDAGGAGPLDLYKQVFDFDVDHPVVQMRPNPDFKQTQEFKAEQLGNGRGHGLKERRLFFSHKSPKMWKKRLVHSLRDLVPIFRRSVESLNPSYQDANQVPTPFGDSDGLGRDVPWLGLDRYLDEEIRDEHAGWNAVEYARNSTLVDCPSVKFTFYWDVPGLVLPYPASEEEDRSLSSPSTNDVNGSDPPAYGLNIVVRGGIINYGPWADRARTEIQNIFFPNPYTNSEPSEALEIGMPRQSTVFKIDIDIASETVLRIPTREESKDWQWKGRADAIKGASKLRQQHNKKHSRFRRGTKGAVGPDIRPFGWLSLSIAPDSAVVFRMDMISRNVGYKNLLDFELKQTKMTSSVNHDLLWRSGPFTGHCDLSNPLEWNGLHHWNFNITCSAFEMFILRDHMFLLTDLIGDWGSSSVPEYWTFVPFRYTLRLIFNDLKLYLNANDSNIINNPSDMEDNTFLIIGGQCLDSTVEIPLEKYRPSQNSVHFRADLENATLELMTPLWNTHNTFLSDHPVATLKHLTLSGLFNYNSDTSPARTDNLVLNLSGDSPRMFLHGFLIRHFIKIKDNYFGEDLHFRTLEEFQGMLSSQREAKDVFETQTIKKDNDLDVLLSVQAHKGCILLPTNLYSRKDNIKLDILLAESDMRFNNYYSDISARFSPVEASLESIDSEEAGAYGTVSNVQLFIDGISIYGHRLFGAGPTEPTYVCNWDFQIGDIKGECSCVFLRSLSLGIQAFTFSLDDDENALTGITATVVNDITFLQLDVSSIRLWLLVDDAALLLSTGNIQLFFNDWAKTSFSGRLNAKVADVHFAAVDRKAAARQRRSDKTPILTFAYFKTALELHMLSKRADHASYRALQLNHVRFHDRRSQRVQCLLRRSNIVDREQKGTSSQLSPPNMPLPQVPEPFQPEDVRHAADKTWQGGKQRVSSFLGSKPPSDRSIPPNFSAGPSFVQENDVHDSSASQLMASGITFSSPWLPPHFTLGTVQPDPTELPLASSMYEFNDQKSGPVDFGNEDFSNEKDQSSNHVGLTCRIKPDLRGYLKPRFIQIISQIVEDLQPLHPADVLDSLQTSTISRIVNTSQSKIKPGNTFDLCFLAPSILIKFMNAYKPLRTPGEVEERDKYELAILQSQLAIRNRNRREEHHTDSPGENFSITIHVSCQELTFDVCEEISSRHVEKATIQGSIQDIEFWLTMGDTLSSNIQLQSIDLLTRGTRIEYLAELIHRTTHMITTSTRDFENAQAQMTQRLRHVVYFLTDSGTTLPDPIFLTRPSYVLRAAGDHLRSNDSWKIISRLRFIYCSLPHAIQQKLIRSCSDKGSECPSHAKEHVLKLFDQWRAWDLSHVSNSEVMKSIWGTSSSESNVAKSHSPIIRLGLLIGRMKFLLDPGPQQSELAVMQINSNFLLTPAEELESPSKNSRETIVIQAFCSDTALQLNWELCELLENTFLLFQEETVKEGSDVTSDPVIYKKKALQPRREIHVVLGTDLASVMLDSVHLTVALAAQNIKASFVHVEATHTSRSDLRVNSLISSSSASAELRSKSRSLMVWNLSQPNLYADFNERVSAICSREIKVAGNCRRLVFEMQEEMLGILDIAERVICDEVASLFGLVSRIQSSSPIHGSDVDSSALSRPSQIRITAALFLDNYSLSFAVLPSLTYIVTGKYARTGIRSKATDRTLVHFDLEEHHHHIQPGSKAARDSVAAFTLPAINGSLLFSHSDELLKVNVDAAIEKIKLDGTAVRGWVDTISQPKLHHAYKEASSATQSIQSRIEGLPTIKRNAPVKASPKRMSGVIYDAKISLAGLSVHTSARGLTGQNYYADLDFELGFVWSRVHNIDIKANTIFRRPQFDVLLDQASFQLSRRTSLETMNYGRVILGISASGKTQHDEKQVPVQSYEVSTDSVLVELYAETAYLVIDIVTHLEQQIKTLDLPVEVKQLQSLRRMTQADLSKASGDPHPAVETTSRASASSALSLSMFSVAIRDIRVDWIVDNMTAMSPGRILEDLSLTVGNIDLATQQENSARLTIVDLQVQMVPKGRDQGGRTLNSALLPEMVFNVAYISTADGLRLALQAAGKALDMRLTSDFIVPASILRNSLASAINELREAKTFRTASADSSPTKKPLFGGKRLASLLVDVDFAGAVVMVQARPEEEQRSVFSILKGQKRSKAGRYGHLFEGDSASQATLRAPGVAVKVEYTDRGLKDASLNAEIKVAASSNILYPSVVPLILEISSSVKEIMGDTDAKSIASEAIQSQIPGPAASLDTNSGLLGRCKLNLGIWVQGQDFSLSCQPIARVAATARFDDIVVTVNTVQAPEQERFFAMLVSFNSLQASVQHVYSRESTANFDVERIVISLMNSKHVSTTTGLSTILKVSPVKTAVNAKQLQDFLLFREIWYPAEIRNAPSGPVTAQAESQPYIVQRYQQVAATGAFPWNAVIAMEELEVQIDLGQSLGKTQLTITKLWASSKKTSDWEQNLCVGFDDIGINSVGRMSGFIEIHHFKIRTTIRWPVSENALQQTPLVQASVGIGELRVKVAFDYQPFVVADITSFDFLMYNVRESGEAQNDRLVAILDGDKVQVFCITNSAAQGLALFQAFERLIQEKQTAYEASIKELERYLRRKSIFPSGTSTAQPPDSAVSALSRADSIRAPLSLHTDVVVTIQALNIGAFPSTFFDNVIFKIEASDAQARFAVSVTNGRTHSGLGLTLGQLRVALSTVNGTNTTAALGEVAVDDVVSRATGSRGGTILKVPRVVATMQTWQEAPSNNIEYIFKSAFEGKVDVGWNYSRISYIRGMFTAHSKALSHRLGKPLSQSAVQITGGPPIPSSSSTEKDGKPQPQPQSQDPRPSEKITAVVNVPESSRFTYTALEPPVIETPQLRDMGEATPPLEWIGLHREKLPNLTHQIIIVALLEVCREVEEAYGSILGGR